jgi:hypothetical protein
LSCLHRRLQLNHISYHHGYAWASSYQFSLLLGRVATAPLSGLVTLLEFSVRSYLVGNAGSRPISEAKQPWACLVLRWGTTGEAHVLYSPQISFFQVKCLTGGLYWYLGFCSMLCSSCLPLSVSLSPISPYCFLCLETRIVVLCHAPYVLLTLICLRATLRAKPAESANCNFKFPYL